MTVKHWILFHNDLDGAASAAIARWALQKTTDHDLVLQAVDYGLPLPEIDYAMDHVTLLDFTFQPFGYFLEFFDHLGDRLTWIDHHASVLAQLAGDRDFDALISGVRRSANAYGTPVCAAELTWEHYIFPRQMGWKDGLRLQPAWLEAIGDWDTWRHAQRPASVGPQVKLAFDAGGVAEAVEEIGRMLHACLEVSRGRETTWLLQHQLAETQCRQLAEAGAALARFEAAQDAELMAQRAYPAEFAGFSAICANIEQRGSGRFRTVYRPEAHALMVAYAELKTGVITCSLYSERAEVDCGALAQRLGKEGPVGTGGGHRGAAGFQTSWAHLQSLITRFPERA